MQWVRRQPNNGSPFVACWWTVQTSVRALTIRRRLLIIRVGTRVGFTRMAQKGGERDCSDAHQAADTREVLDVWSTCKPETHVSNNETQRLRTAEDVGDAGPVACRGIIQHPVKDSTIPNRRTDCCSLGLGYLGSTVHTWLRCRRLKTQAL